jgi:hypothetical protein
MKIFVRFSPLSFGNKVVNRKSVKLKEEATKGS